MNWDDLRVLLTLLEVRNLHDAGKRLGIDRSTASRRLSALESSLGTRLFARSRDGLQPTSAAERVRPFAEKIAAEATDLVNAARQEEVEASGVVRVATTEAIATVLVDNGLFLLREQHPALTLEIVCGN